MIFRGLWALFVSAVVVLSACNSTSAAPSSAVASTAPPTTATSPPGSLAVLQHLAVDRIGLDYPAGWTVRSPAPGVAPPFGGLTFVGTAPSTGGCTPTGANSNTCGPDFHLAPGLVSVAVYWLDGPMAVDPFGAISEPAADDKRMTIDNVPTLVTAVHHSRYAADATELTMTLPGPSFTAPPIFVLAEVQAPPEDPLFAQVKALFASIHYEPALHPTASMSASAAMSAAADAIRRLTDGAGQSGTLPCLQPPGGPPRSAVLTQVQGGPPLTKPLPVTCSTRIEGTPVEAWRFVIAISWTAAADRGAGSTDMITWVGLDGYAIPWNRTGDAVPYEP